MDSGIVNFLLSALPYLIALLVLVSIARAFCFFKSRTTNKQLKEREQLLYTLINEIPDPLVLKDHKGNFLLANQACATLYNTTPEAMVGKHDGDFGVPKEQADFFRQNVLNIMAKGETEVVFEDSTDVKAGMTRHYKSIKKPFKTTDGLNQILVLAQDITDVLNAQGHWPRVKPNCALSWTMSMPISFLKTLMGIICLPINPFVIYGVRRWTKSLAKVTTVSLIRTRRKSFEKTTTGF